MPKKSSSSSPLIAQLDSLEMWLASVFAKAPHVPPNVQKILVTIAPWYALITGVAGFLFILSAVNIAGEFFGMSGVMPPIGQMRGMTTLVLVGVFFIAAESILKILAFAPLKKYDKKGWDYLFYAMILSTLLLILQLLVGLTSSVEILWALLGYWLLFEIRGKYK